MAAANTDLFKKLSRKWVGQIGSGGVADAVTTTIPLASPANLPTDTAVALVINRVDADGNADATQQAKEETIIGVVSGSNLVNCVRGVEGTAQAHDAGAVVELVITAKGINDIIDGILTQHDQLGRHTNITASNISASAVITACSIDFNAAGSASSMIRDANDNELIKFTQTASAVNELTVANAATGNAPSISATGGDTNIDLRLTPKGSGVITVPSGTYEDNVTDPDDIPNKAYVDARGSTTGWLPSSDTWTYASASSFTISGVDRTTIFTKGTRIKLTDSGGVKYFVVTSSSFSANTTVNITGGSDYTLANSAISNNYYSYQLNPQGYPTWFIYDPVLSGTGGSIGTHTKTTTIARFKVDGASCTLCIVLTITDKGSWSGDIIGLLPITALVSSAGVFAGTIAATSANPYTASKGMPTLYTTGYFGFIKAVAAATTAWSDVAVNDQINLSGTYVI